MRIDVWVIKKADTGKYEVDPKGWVERDGATRVRISGEDAQEIYDKLKEALEAK